MENVRYFLSDEHKVDPNTSAILEQMAMVTGVVRPIVALPDLHFKYSYHTPTGVAVLSKSTIIPKFVNANCGMTFITTPFFKDDIDEEKLDGVFNYLRKKISVSTRLEPVISKRDLEDIVTKGAEWTFLREGLDPEDLKNFENEGDLFKGSGKSNDEIMSYVPQVCRDVGLLSLGVLGYGNHFIEMQVVNRIADKETAGLFGISEKQVCFMIHSDSRAFGQALIDFYSEKSKKLLGLQQAYKKIHYSVLASEKIPLFAKKGFDRLNFHLNRMKSTVYWKADKFTRKEKSEFGFFEAGSKEAEAYLMSTYCAINYGYANRAYLASLIRDALKEGLNEKDAEIHILHDGNHDSLQKENIDGEEYFAHRNGAARAMPASYYPNHPVFSKTGQPVLLPSSLGRPSFLCAAKKGCRESYYSTCHGAGRSMDRGEAREKFDAESMFSELEAANMKVYDYGKGKAQEESPGSFKNAEHVLKAMSDNDIAQPVAKMKPVAALKGWR
ncbi:MAG: RtcB family protein [Candidatus Omnitrophota bacterium]